MTRIDEDFPRGKPVKVEADTTSTQTKKRKIEEDDDNQLFQSGGKRKVDSKSKKSKKGAVEAKPTDGLWIKTLSYDYLTEGVMGMGVVTEIHDDHLILESVDSCSLKLAANQIGKLFTTLLKAEKISLEQCFTMGQMVPFKVIKEHCKIDGPKHGKAKFEHPQVTCDPSKLNNHLIPTKLECGLVIHALVESIEEKGAILNIGLSNVKGFLPLNKQPSKGIFVGLPILTRIESNGGRVVKLTSFVEQDNLSVEACDRLELSNLMPGTVVECIPTEDEPLARGVIVTLGNEVKALIQRKNLPPRLRADTSRFTRPVRCVVMVCAQNANILILSAHPDIVAISKPEKRTHFLDIKVGDKIKGTVLDSNSFINSVTFSLPVGDDGKTPLLTAISFSTLLHLNEDFESTYPIGSTHTCRVLSFRYADRSILVTTRKDKIKQIAVSFSEFNAGQFVEAKVVQVNEKGAHVLINEDVRGFLPLAHIADANVDIAKAFPVDRVFKCRILSVDSERKRVEITARPSFLRYTDTIIKSYDETIVGTITIGVIVHANPKSFLVSFFNKVKGILPFGMMGDASLKIGSVVSVRVLKCVPEEKHIALTLADAAVIASKNHTKYIASSLALKVHSGRVTDVRVSEVNGRRVESVYLTIKQKGETHEAMLSSFNTSDALDQPFESFSELFKVGQIVNGLVPLGTSFGVQRVAAKPFVSEWVEKKKFVPTSIDQLKEDNLVCGIVAQKSELGAVIEIIGGAGLTGKIYSPKKKNSQEKEDEVGLQIGQTVVARVSKIYEKIRFTLDKRIENCFPNQKNLFELSESLAKSYIGELNTLSSYSKDFPAIGVPVKANVTHIVDDIVFVRFADNILGHISNGNYPPNTKVGDQLECTVMEYAFPRKDAEMVCIPNLKARAPKNCRVVQVKKDYFVVLNGRELCFVPNRLHPNIVPLGKKGRVAFGDNVDLINTVVVENASIGFLENDQEVLTKMANGDFSERKALKPMFEYTGTVLGAWDDDNTPFAVKVALPFDNIGRLHISEFPKAYVEGKKNIMKSYEAFIKTHLNKKVHVRFIEILKINDDKVRVAELTMNEKKLGVRRRGKLLNYDCKFKNSNNIVCFATGETSAQGVCVSVNPLADGVINLQTLPSKYIAKNESSQTGAVVDLKIPKGEVFHASIVSFTSHKRKKSLILNTGAERRAKVLEKGQSVSGRVQSVQNDLYVKFVLASGELATLNPTAISRNYEHLKEALSKFHKNELYQLHLFKREHKPSRVFLVSAARLKDVVDVAEGSQATLTDPRQLITEIETFESFRGQTMEAIVTANCPQKVFLELSPSVKGALKKEEGCSFADLPVGSVVSVVIKHVVKERGWVQLKFKAVIYNSLKKIPSTKKTVEKEKVLKQKNDQVSETAAVPAKKVKEPKSSSVPPKEIEDPGFDFANTGFTNADLAVAAKLGQETATLSGHDGLIKDMAVSEVRQKLKVLMSKEKTDLEKEIDLVEAENAIQEEGAETDEDFNRLIRKDPNSAEPWIRYMSYFLEKSDLVKARATAERALASIHFREEAEILNMWIAYLNMEVAFGDEMTVRAIFHRACQNADAFKVYKQMALIYIKNGKIAEADELYQIMITKFRASGFDGWVMYGTHLMNTERVEKCREILQKALLSVPKARHSELITKFALLEFKKGDPEKGRTLFESLIMAYPKKTDIVIVYADAVVKHSGIEDARSVLDRACNLPLNMHKLRPIFKKWVELEDKYGDETSQQMVRTKAEKCVKDIVEDL